MFFQKILYSAKICSSMLALVHSGAAMGLLVAQIFVSLAAGWCFAQKVTCCKEPTTQTENILSSARTGDWHNISFVCGFTCEFGLFALASDWARPWVPSPRHQSSQTVCNLPCFDAVGQNKWEQTCKSGDKQGNFTIHIPLKNLYNYLLPATVRNNVPQLLQLV